MALIKCKECGHEVSDKASACPNCGCPLNTDSSNQNESNESFSRKKRWLWILSTVFLCLLCGVGYYTYANFFNKETKAEKLIINKEVEKEDIVELTPDFIRAIEKYDELGIFNGGYAAVKRGNKWGYINTKGEEVIPTSLDARYAGVFSEGLALLLQQGGRFSVINTKGEIVFSINDYSGGYYDGYNRFWIPFYKNGRVYIYNNISYKYEIYDTQGNLIGKTDLTLAEDYYIKRTPKPLYSSYSINDGNDWGVKDDKGNVVVGPYYDGTFICSFMELSGGSISNGVVLVKLDERRKEKREGVAPSDNVISYYGYADLKGNDTFSKEIRGKINESNESISQEDNSDWLQGRWVGEDANSGYPIEVIIRGNNLIQKINGQERYNGPYEFNGDMLIYNNANDFWPVDGENKVLTFDGIPMRKEDGGSSSYSSSPSSSNSSSSNNSSYRFSSSHDVIGYLADKTFYNGSRRLRIRPDGVWLNDYCATGAPKVERFESWKALIRAYTATGQRLSFLINPIHGQVTDEAGDVFSLR